MAKRSATGVTSGIGTPFKLDGINGDMTVRTSSAGKKLYVKDFNKWHGINLNINTLQIKNDVDKLLADVKKLKINKSRRPLFDSVYFRVGGSATVQLKNGGAGLKVRNLADDADAAISASTGTYSSLLKCDSYRGLTAVNTIKFGNGAAVLQSTGDNDITIQTGNSTTGSISIVDGANGAINVTPNGSGAVVLYKVDIAAGEIDGTAIGANSASTIKGTTGELTGNTLKIGTGITGFLLKNTSGVCFIRNVGDSANANLACNNIRAANIKDVNDDKIVETSSVGGTITNHILMSNGRSTHSAKIASAGDDTNVTLELNTKGTGNLLVDVGGDVILEPASGGVKIAEASAAAADTAGYGQIWIDDAAPNELCFTDDAGTDIVGVGKYHYESKVCGFTSTNTANFLPLIGGLEEQSNLLGKNEYIGMVAPYTGTIEKILFRCEEAQNGTLQMDIHESADGTEFPAASAVATKDTSINVADDTTQDISFASMTSGTNVITKGRIYAIKITAPSAPNDTNVTVVFKWDITT